MSDADGALLENDILRVSVSPGIGGSITEIVHKPSGASVLGRVPWDPVNLPEAGLAAVDETTWLTRYTGGWPLMFPNAGDACRFDGHFHGFHGEASVSPWQAEVTPDRIRLTRRFFGVPVRMVRDLTLAGDVLCLRETAVSDGPSPVQVMWGQHVTFGSDLLEAPVILETGARRIVVDDSYDPGTNPWQPGAEGSWPFVAGKLGEQDMSLPQAPCAALAYLTDFAAPFVALRRLDGAIGVVLSWQGAVYDCLWYWCELGGTADPPWHGRARLIGLEPCSTWPGRGLAEAAKRGARLIELRSGVPVETLLRLQVFRGNTPVIGTDPDGRARFRF